MVLVFIFMVFIITSISAIGVEVKLKSAKGEDEDSSFMILSNETFHMLPKITKERDESIPMSFSLENCPSVKEDMLNVHFILHSHDDVGWLKTPDQYYDEDVKQILFSVMEQLNKGRNRKFVYSEMYYFKKWWTELNSTMRERVTGFVTNGQLEFVGGGWVQNDEALSHYSVIIDQISYGLNQIKKLFGIRARPAVGWQIDSFGYSKEQASFFAQFGYNAEVIQRLPWYDLQRRRDNKDMEFYWQGDASHKIFTHILYDSYVAPAGFQYETDIHASSNIDNGNVKEKVQRMIQVAKHRSESYNTNHLMMLMGHDFVYKDASIWFDNIQKLIEHGNAIINKTNVHFLYSTPSCYFKHAFKILENVTLSKKLDDFFPYCNNRVSMWTGFYSSRPTLKRLVNKISSILQTVQNLENYISTAESKQLLDEMREKFFTTLHHDAITGTCKQAVANEYANTLLSAESIGQTLLQKVYAKILGKKFGENQTKDLSSEVYFCSLDICPFSQTQSKFSITIFNGHSKRRFEYITIPVESTDYQIIHYDNVTVLQYQIIKLELESEQLRQAQGSKYSLVMLVDLPAVGFSTYRIQKSFNDTKPPSKEPKFKNYIENEFYKVAFNEATGLIEEITDKVNKRTLNLTQNFFWYENEASGAYIFRPTISHPVTTEKVSLKRLEGFLVQEMRQTFNNWVTQIVRLYKKKNYVEVQWTISPYLSDEGKEIVTRFDSDIKNGDTFFTDANGRQMVERKSVLPSPQPSEYPIASAYYPLASMIKIKDDRTQLTVVTDRAIGGSSISSGSLELLLHRIVMNDDGAGMGESLNETDSDGRPIVVRGVYRFVVSNIDEPHLDNRLRDMAKDMFYTPYPMFSNYSKALDNLFKFSMLPGILPDGVHLLSFQSIDENHILIRLENYFQEKMRTVSMQAIANVKSCTEMMLSGDVENSTSNSRIDIYAINLEPMSIITLLCSLT